MKNNKELFQNKIALAPMATGGNLPYRRLCRYFGAQLTCSEMVLAHKIVKGSKREEILLRKGGDEAPYGVQLAGKKLDVMSEAAKIVADSGCDYIDLNFGCPIDVIVRKGSGASVLKSVTKLGRIVDAVRNAVDLPLLVKLRVGYHRDKINIEKTAVAAYENGADCLSIHGRTREQRYKKDADWSLIARAAELVDIPVLGNGDILTVWDYQKHQNCGVSGVVLARGALIKPWLFKELIDGEPWYPTVQERWQVMAKYVEFAKEYFGDDEKGMERVKRFFIWHLGFWNRYRPYTEEDFNAAGGSLIQMRDEDIITDPELKLLASNDPDDYEVIWQRVVIGEH
jgi:tRNA-dihydrouridine synthase 3